MWSRRQPSGKLFFQLRPAGRLLCLLGIGGGLSLTYVGFRWGIPTLGTFGIAWTVLVLSVSLYNAYMYFLHEWGPPPPPLRRGPKTDEPPNGKSRPVPR